MSDFLPSTIALITTTPINLKLTSGMIVIHAAKRFLCDDFARDFTILRISFTLKGIWAFWHIGGFLE